jgi:hypothetical protein
LISLPPHQSASSQSRLWVLTFECSYQQLEYTNNKGLIATDGNGRRKTKNPLIGSGFGGLLRMGLNNHLVAKGGIEPPTQGFSVFESDYLSASILFSID